MTAPADLLAGLVALVEERAGRGDDLDRLVEAADIASEVGDLPDRLVGLYVDRARACGATWSQIGDALGVSKQAVQQRSVPAAFDRYTNRARHVVERAQELARTHGQVALGPSLLLVAACLDVDSLAARALARCGVDIEALCAALVDALPPAADAVPDRPAFTITAKQVLDQAVREATRLGHDYVGTEHLLLAALRQPEGLPPEAVRTFGLAYDEAAPAVAQLLAEPVGLRARIARSR